MPYIGDPRTGFSASFDRLCGVGVVAVRGELDEETVPELQLALEAAVGAGRPVVVDLDGVSFMDSQGLYALMVLRRRLRDQGCPMALVHRPGGAVALLLSVSGARELFDAFASRAGAFASVG
jgi:anti-sigma B factor antagonist